MKLERCKPHFASLKPTLFFVGLLFIVHGAMGMKIPPKGPDITGEYQFEGTFLWKAMAIDNTVAPIHHKDRKSTIYITKTGNGVHLEGEVPSESTEDQKKLSARDIALLTGDFIWSDAKGAFRNSSGKSVYYLYKVSDKTLALRNEAGNVELGKFQKKEGSLGDLVSSIRNDVSNLIGNWKVEGTTANIGLTSGIKNDLNLRYGTSVYELNKEDGGVFESYFGKARGGEDPVTIQVVSNTRLKLDIAGSTLYANRNGSVSKKASVQGTTDQFSTSGGTMGFSGQVTGTTGNPQTKLLFAAVSSGDLDAVNELISQEINLNVKNAGGRTPLIESIYKNNAEILERLLEANADVNLTDNQGRSPLVTAIQKSNSRNMGIVTSLLDRRPTITLTVIDESLKKNDTDLTRLLLDADANQAQMAKRAIETGKTTIFDLLVNEYNAAMTPILFDTALNNRKFAIADKMIANGFDPVYALNASVKRDAMDLVYTALEQGGNADTALSYAVNKRETELVKLAVTDYGADANKVFPAAVASKNIEIVAALLANGADPNGQMTVVGTSGNLQLLDLFLTQGANPDLALLPAAKANKNQAIALLLQNGADANKLLVYGVDNSNVSYVKQSLQAGATATDPKLMSVAGAKGNIEVVTALLAAGASANDAILPATKANKLAIVQKLLAAGADGSSGELVKASAVHNNPNLTQLFLQAGADAQAGMNSVVLVSADKTLQLLIDNGAQVENPMLITAVKNNSYACARILTAQGLTGNMRETSTGYTLLHYSAKNSNASLTSLLLDHNAPVNAEVGGNTPLHLAVQNRKGLATVDALIRAGANVNAVNGKGKSILRIAKGSKIKKLLKQKGATK